MMLLFLRRSKIERLTGLICNPDVACEEGLLIVITKTRWIIWGMYYIFLSTNLSNLVFL